MSLPRRLALLKWASRGAGVGDRGRLRQRVPVRGAAHPVPARPRRRRPRDLRRQLQQDALPRPAPGLRHRAARPPGPAGRRARRAPTSIRPCSTRPSWPTSSPRATSRGTCAGCARAYRERLEARDRGGEALLPGRAPAAPGPDRPARGGRPRRRRRRRRVPRGGGSRRRGRAALGLLRPARARRQRRSCSASRAARPDAASRAHGAAWPPRSRRRAGPDRRSPQGAGPPGCLARERGLPSSCHPLPAEVQDALGLADAALDRLRRHDADVRRHAQRLEEPAPDARGERADGALPAGIAAGCPSTCTSSVSRVCSRRTTRR